MQKVNFYIFSPSFFEDTDSIRSFIGNAYEAINKKREGRETEAFFQASLLHNLAKKISDTYNKSLLCIAEINILNHIAYSKSLLEAYQQSKEKIESINLCHLDDKLTNEYYAVKGEIYLNIFKLKNHDNGLESIKQQNPLFVAKKCYSFLLNQFLSGNIQVENTNTQKILIHYCETLGHLSRYVEPFFLLNTLKKHTSKYKASIPLAEVFLLDAIFEKTCNASNPLILIKIRSSIKNVLKLRQTLDSRNIPYLKEIDKRVNKILLKYCKSNNTTQKKLERLLHDGEKNNKLNKYQKFIRDRQLFLNEHSLYCQCKVGTIDNLSIKAACNHTNHYKVKQYELLLENLIFTFNSSRESYYKATTQEGKKRVYKSIVSPSKYIENGIINNVQSRELLNSFKDCFSVLDKIAVGVNSAFSILDKGAVKTIHFNSFFKRKDVKQVIQCQENNLYLMAMYSMSQDLDKGSEFSDFHEYKDWRNAIEHQELYLVERDCDVSKLKAEYPNVEFFIPFDEFKQKAMYLLHLSRSAIFTFVWVIRKASRKWDENENSIQLLEEVI